MKIERATPASRRTRALGLLVGVAAVGLAVACGDGGSPDPGGTGGIGTVTNTATSPAPTSAPPSTGANAPTIITFERVGPACDSNGQVTLRWTLGGTATGATISIDGPGIFDTYPGTSHEEKFPGACGSGNTQTFLLRTLGGSPVAEQTIVVNPAAPSPSPTAPTIITFERVGPACDSNGQVTLRWTLGGTATGATISIDGPGIFDTYPGTSHEEKFPGACGSGNTQTFLLRTLGGSPVAERTIVVNP